MDLIDHLLPQWQFAERHERRIDGVTADQVFDAIVPGMSAEDPWIGKAIALRETPGRLLRALGLSRNALPTQPFGFHSFTPLGQTPGREVVFGLAGQFWRLDYGLRPIADANAFAAMDDQPRLALSVSVQAQGTTGCQLLTHTRVHCPTDAQRRRFAPYWYAIRPVSGLIRQRMLQRIAQHCLTGTT